MNYQVWIKDEYEDKYTKVDCGDLGAAKREIDKAIRVGGEPILTVAVPYSLAIKVGDVVAEKSQREENHKKPGTKEKEESKSEVSQGEAEADKDPGTKGKGKV